MKNVTIAGAFASGVLTFFSPCILPLIPVYFSMLIGGIELKNIKRGEAVIRTLLFIWGFGLIFVLLGLTSTLIGKYLNSNIYYFKKLSGIIIIFFGLFLMDIIKLKFLLITKKYNIKYSASYGSNLLLGLVFGFAWTQCVGPILGSILILASTSGKVLDGIILLLSYALGISIPFLLVSLIGEPILIRIKTLHKYSNYIKIASGIILILFGLLIILNKI